MRIIGVDPGTHRLGFGVIDVDGLQVSYVDSGCLSAPRKAPIEIRLNLLHHELKAIVSNLKPNHLAIEEPFVAPTRGAKSAIAVGQAQALALIIAAEHKLNVYRYAPAAVKASASGYGASTKSQVQRVIRILLSLGPDPMSEDESDALAVGLCHIQHLRTFGKIGKS
tara:strand:+ start:3519 stop:4019 length:501 start_codon:yes stop_codon:yes gene_type:complete